MIPLFGHFFPIRLLFPSRCMTLSPRGPGFTLLQVFVANQHQRTILLPCFQLHTHLGKVSDAIPERLHAACQNLVRSSIKRGWISLSGMNRKGRSNNALIEVRCNLIPSRYLHNNQTEDQSRRDAPKHRHGPSATGPGSTSLVLMGCKRWT